MKAAKLRRWSPAKFRDWLDRDSRSRGAIAAAIATAAGTATGAGHLRDWARDDGARPGVDTVLAIAHVLRVSVDDLTEVA